MAEEFTAAESSVGEMHKRRETMADGRRYIIYYTFGPEAAADESGESAVDRASEVKADV